MAESSTSEPITNWDVITYALTTGKYILPLIICLIFAGLAAIIAASVYRGAKSEIAGRNGEMARRQAVIESKIKSGAENETTSPYDFYTDQVATVEPSGQLSIVATISSFGRSGALQPSTVLSEAQSEVLRPLTAPFKLGDPVAAHEVLKIEPLLSSPPRSASLVVVARHSDLFHGPRSAKMVQQLANVERALSVMLGADLTMSLYVPSSDTPDSKYFFRLDGKAAFSTSDLADHPFEKLEANIETHPGGAPKKKEALKAHVDYVLNRSRISGEADETYVLVLLPEAAPDPELIRTPEFYRWVQIYTPEKNDQEARKRKERARENFEQFGILQFADGIMAASEKGTTSSDLRSWAGRYAPGTQAKYKVYWDPDDFDTRSKAYFYMHFIYQHFDMPAEATIRVLYDGKI